jgi:hypothetical protein
MDTEFGPGNGLYPASGDEHRPIVKPVTASNVEVAEVPASLIHDKALKDSKLAVGCPDLIPEHM